MASWGADNVRPRVSGYRFDALRESPVPFSSSSAGGSLSANHRQATAQALPPTVQPTDNDSAPMGASGTNGDSESSHSHPRKVLVLVDGKGKAYWR